ncbi:MAG: TonB-dependent receptor domain-containing protein [Bryobacteraceae bacterium]
MRLAVFVLCAGCAFAQSFTGNIIGTVKDQTGGVVPGVEVVITHLETNRRVTAVTNTRGEYVSVPLGVGQYRVEASARGFKQAVRSGITLALQQTAVVDLTLAVGDTAERIEVIGEAPLLETTEAAIGQVVNNRQIRELPLNTRNVYSLVFLTAGVVGSTGNDHEGMAGWAVFGTRRQMMDVVIDGAPAAHPTANGFTGMSIFPPVDAIQEFKLMGSNFSAEYGRSAGSVLNIVYKSGSNDLHGSVFEFLRNSVLDANGFFANRRGEPLASFKRNQFGGTLSGPVKKDRTFFMASFEGLRERRFSSSTFSVPTLAQRDGDFSQTLDRNGRLVQMFDPYTTRANPSGGFIRTAFAGNVIPKSRMDPVGVNAIKYYPTPNQPGDSPTLLNNYFKTGSASTTLNNYDYRLDHNLTTNQKVFGRFSHRYNLDAPAITFPSDIAIAEGRINNENTGNNAVIEYSNTLSAKTVLTARTGFSRTLFNYGNQGVGFVPSTLGLPKIIDTYAGPAMFPYFTVSGYKALGHRDHRHTAFNTYSANAALARLSGQHSLKVGFDGRLIRVNLLEARAPSGEYPFSAAFTQGPDPLRASSTAGNGIASLLLGTGNAGSRLFTYYKNVAAQNFYLAGYVQDDWKVASRLTLNLGLRYDFETPRTERHNHLNYFDPYVQSPLKVPGFPDLRGGLIYVGENGASRYQFKVDKLNFAPRFGFAYQATRRTVIRGGYAHIYAPSFKAASGSDTPWGFRGETQWIATIDGITPLTPLSNPYPNGFAPPTGASLGLLSGMGDDLRPVMHDNNVPWTQQWNVTIQRELRANMLVEIGYVGTRGRQLPVYVMLNQLDPKYMALGSKLNTTVDNPFYGIVPRGIHLSQRISQAQLLRPYPQFGALEGSGRDSGGRSWYDGMIISAKNRLWHGLQFEGSYTWSKTFDQGENYQNYYDLKASRGLASTEQAHNFVIGYMYEMPFGRGKRFGADMSRLADAFVGGWQINGITSLKSGTPIQITASNTAGVMGRLTAPNNNGKSGKLEGPAQSRLDRWFDTSVFSQPAPFTFGNMAPNGAGIRNDMVRNHDLSLFKEFAPREQLRVQFRLEALNAFNTPRFSSPTADVNSGSFGRVSGQSNAPRQVQLGLKLLW